MIGSDIKLIDFNETGLSLLIKAMNSRYYPLDLSRGTIGDTRIVNGKNITSVTLDKYPLLSDDHPTVLKNGRYYSFDVDTTRFTGNGPITPQVLKIIAIPFQSELSSWRFTVDGIESPIYDDLSAMASAVTNWGLDIAGNIAINILTATDDYKCIMLANLQVGTVRNIKVEELSNYDFNYSNDIVTATDITVRSVTSGLPNLLSAQVKVFQPTEFTTPYTVDLTYYQASNSTGTPIACVGGTAVLGLKGILVQQPTIPVTKQVYRVEDVDGTITELNNPAAVSSAGADDINLAFRLKREGLTQVRETDILAPVLNTKIQTIEYLPNNENYIQYYKDAMMRHTVQMLSTNMQANPQGIGVVDGVDAKQHLVRVL